MDSSIFQSTNFPNYSCAFAAGKAKEISLDDSGNGSLTRYHSAPSSVFQSLLDDEMDGGDGDHLFVDEDGDPELLSRLLSDGIGSFASLITHNTPAAERREPAPPSQVAEDFSPLPYMQQDRSSGAGSMRSGGVVQNSGGGAQPNSYNLGNMAAAAPDSSNHLIIADAHSPSCCVEDLLDNNMGILSSSLQNSSISTHHQHPHHYPASVDPDFRQYPPRISVASDSCINNVAAHQPPYSPMMSSTCSTEGGSCNYGSGKATAPMGLPPQPPKTAGGGGGGGGGGLIRHRSSPAHVLSTAATEEMRRKQRRAAAAAVRNGSHSPMSSISEHRSGENTTANDELCSSISSFAAGGEQRRMLLPANITNPNLTTFPDTRGSDTNPSPGLVRHSSSPAHLLSRLAMEEKNRLARRKLREDQRGGGNLVPPLDLLQQQRQRPPLSPPYERQANRHDQQQPMQIDYQTNYNIETAKPAMLTQIPNAATSAAAAQYMGSSYVNGVSHLNNDPSIFAAKRSDQLPFAETGGGGGNGGLLWNSGRTAAAPPLYRQSSSPAGLLSQIALQEEISMMRRENDNRNYHHNRDNSSAAYAPSPSTSNSSGSSAETGPHYDRSHGGLSFHHDSASAALCNNGQRKRSRARGLAHDADNNHSSAAGIPTATQMQQQQQQVRSPNSGGSSNSPAAALQQLLLEEEEGNISPPPLLNGGVPFEDVDGAAEDSVLCRARAKRGHATHPRSIAERVRRTKISERIKKLQDLVPNLDKQANTADMLDEVVEYVKVLQRQIEELSLNRPVCNCSVRSQ